MPRVTHWTRYPQTCCASHARLALHHVGAFDVRVSAPMPGRVLGRSGAAYSYRRVGLHVDSAMPCRYLVAWCDPDHGQRVGGYLHGYLHGYLLTIGPSAHRAGHRVQATWWSEGSVEILRAGGGKGGVGGWGYARYWGGWLYICITLPLTRRKFFC